MLTGTKGFETGSSDSRQTRFASLPHSWGRRGDSGTPRTPVRPRRTLSSVIPAQAGSQYQRCCTEPFQPPRPNPLTPIRGGERGGSGTPRTAVRLRRIIPVELVLADAGKRESSAKGVARSPFNPLSPPLSKGDSREFETEGTPLILRRVYDQTPVRLRRIIPAELVLADAGKRESSAKGRCTEAFQPPRPNPLSPPLAKGDSGGF